ncbi:MAG TPA: isoprenylcysteine carboxylmethyltransferase family protein [Jatrophihabitantaceae bacterium]|nr:isoprenylcysteine carboxylmethyltransferase family protein [Jatrophihabitantaceae bacterium]
MADAPQFRIWPPVALGVPLAAGVTMTASVGDPFDLPTGAARVLGWALVVLFAIWNGWTLRLMAQARTALLPGGATRAVLDHGTFGISRNPLYVGLVVLDAGLALLWPSTWALLFVPAGFAAVHWGAVLPEERYLSAKFGSEYDTYRRRVRRWL